MNSLLKYFGLIATSMVVAFFSTFCLSQQQVNQNSLKKTSEALYDDYLGQWQTIDDDSNLPRSLVTISIEKDQLQAKITKVYPAKGESEKPVCEKCQGELKNIPIIGLNILKNMQFEDNVWRGGEILDPNNGKFYDAKIWLENDQLQVRGYIGFFFRTQQWRRLPAAN